MEIDGACVKSSLKAMVRTTGLLYSIHLSFISLRQTKGHTKVNVGGDFRSHHSLRLFVIPHGKGFVVSDLIARRAFQNCLVISQYSHKQNLIST